MGRIINQPQNGKLGDLIKENLALHGERSFDNFYFVVAFAKKSGISRIQDAMQRFRENRGVIKGVVGIDNKVTTRQGLELLMRFVDEVYIYHDERTSQSFHPKIYIFEKEGRYARVYLGSSNLTQGGLFTNYEINEELIFRLENPDDSTQFSEIKEIFDFYSNVDDENRRCRLLDPILLNKLNERNLLDDEEVQQREISVTARRAHEIETLFGIGPSVTVPPPYREEEVEAEPETSTLLAEQDILIRAVPFASGRTSQVHFTRRIVENYFGFALGETRRLRFRQFRSGQLGSIEERPLVYSTSNKNPKIELAGARRLTHNYPAGERRPILVFEKIEEDLFHYMLILPGDDGFTELTNHLASVPRHGLALKYDFVDKRTILRIWPTYPIS